MMNHLTIYEAQSVEDLCQCADVCSSAEEFTDAVLREFSEHREEYT